jgi:hypothetical protein
MATASPKDILRVPGRLCLDPTDLSTAFPHGGTALGVTRVAAWAGGERGVPITAEEYGGVTVEAVHSIETAAFSCIYRAWDKDALAATLVDTVAGGTTARQVWQARVQTDDVRPGTLLSTKAGILYWSPLADAHPGLLVYHALPMPEAASRLQFSAIEPFEIAAVWHASPDDQGRLFAIGLRDDLSIT